MLRENKNILRFQNLASFDQNESKALAYFSPIAVLTFHGNSFPFLGTALRRRKRKKGKGDKANLQSYVATEETLLPL